MSIHLQSSKNYPGRIALTHRHHPDSTMSTTLDISWEDLEELAHQAQQVLGNFPRRIDIAQTTYADGTRTVLNLINEALCADNTASVYVFENRKG